MSLEGLALDIRSTLAVWVTEGLFDAYYNGGHAVEWLQQAVGARVDGVLGPATLAAVRAAPPILTVARFDAYRLNYLADLGTWPSFGRGWAHRIANNLLKAAA